MAPLHDPPNGSAPPPPGERARTAALYAAHWRYVRNLLPIYGIPAEAQRDLAQSIWLTVQERIASYDAAIHKTPRAWLTGIVRRCAANCRRMLKRHSSEILHEDPGALVAAPGLDPEQAALLGTLRQAIRDADRCEALILQVHHGLSIEEIAAATGATESAVEWRLRMAKQDLEDDDDGKKGRAFLGFGSLEALAEALRPKPIPDEVGAEEWKEIARRIDAGEKPDVSDSEPPPSSLPPPPAVPAVAPSGTTATAAAISKGTLGSLVVVAFFVGASTGGLLARQAHERPPSVAMEGLCLAPASQPTAAPADTAPPHSGASTPAGSTTPSTPSTRATPAGSVTSASGAPVGPSLRLLLQMRHAAEVGNFAAVLTFADEHARAFPATDVTEREHERRKALEQMARRAATGRALRSSRIF